MKIAIMQPTYIPWLGYFDLMDSVDKFVFLDDVKLVKCSWHVRNRIKTSQGGLYLTVPIRRTKGRDKLILDKTIITNSGPWQKKHLKSMFFAYRKAEFFDEIYAFIEETINKDIILLSDFNINFIISLCRMVGIKKEFILSSNLENIFGEKDMRLISLCQSLGGSEYLSPQGSAAYINRESPGGEFPKSDVTLFYQNYQHPRYRQLYGDFISHMSIIDLLFNHGFDESLKILRSGRREPIDYLSFGKNALGVRQKA